MVPVDVSMVLGMSGIGHGWSGETDVQDGLCLARSKQMRAVLVGRETATGAFGGSECKRLVVLTLFVVTKGLYRSTEETCVYDGVCRMKREVENLRPDVNVWHDDRCGVNTAENV